MKQLVYFGALMESCVCLLTSRSHSLTEMFCFPQQRVVIRMAKLISPCISLIPGEHVQEIWG